VFCFFKRVENEQNEREGEKGKKLQCAKRAFCALLRIHVQQQQNEGAEQKKYCDYFSPQTLFPHS
jgi:hypothetical protein